MQAKHPYIYKRKERTEIVSCSPSEQPSCLPFECLRFQVCATTASEGLCFIFAEMEKLKHLCDHSKRNKLGWEKDKDVRKREECQSHFLEQKGQEPGGVAVTAQDRARDPAL